MYLTKQTPYVHLYITKPHGTNLFITNLRWPAVCETTYAACITLASRRARVNAFCYIVETHRNEITDFLCIQNQVIDDIAISRSNCKVYVDQFCVCAYGESTVSLSVYSVCLCCELPNIGLFLVAKYLIFWKRELYVMCLNK